MSALIILLANGRRTLPMTKRKIQALVYGSIVVSAALTWFLADVWFSFIEFQPVWIGVVGSLGLLALSLWDRYRKNREQLATLRKKLPK
ncbi:hypothetical protein FC34_GL000592 [Lacticaseibacillus brantae DSM 23927]|uniref:Uncharacterized protein n=2 Tax=Lacticaseibacillus brantae TaxID=943673 RepID=A0A0R2B0L7_9LACO|nr:hypothetical protein FC34_GL000592 [Lacticaseibacillus brantae DSM 23927]